MCVNYASKYGTYNKSQQYALLLKCILVKNSTCFGQTYSPSSGVLIRYSQQLVFVILVGSAGEIASRQSTQPFFSSRWVLVRCHFHSPAALSMGKEAPPPHHSFWTAGWFRPKQAVPFGEENSFDIADIRNAVHRKSARTLVGVPTTIIRLPLIFKPCNKPDEHFNNTYIIW